MLAPTGMIGVAPNAFSRLPMDVGEASATHHNEDVRGLDAVRVLCNEILAPELRNENAGLSFSMSHDRTLSKSILE